MLLVAGSGAVKQHCLEPTTRLVTLATHSLAPNNFAEAPVEAIRKVVGKAGLQLHDIDLFEINKAFAAVPHGCHQTTPDRSGQSQRQWRCRVDRTPDRRKRRPAGSKRNTRMRHRKARYGVASLCIGGGEAVAALFETA